MSKAADKKPQIRIDPDNHEKLEQLLPKLTIKTTLVNLANACIKAGLPLVEAAQKSSK